MTDEQPSRPALEQRLLEAKVFEFEMLDALKDKMVYVDSDERDNLIARLVGIGDTFLQFNQVLVCAALDYKALLDRILEKQHEDDVILDRIPSLIRNKKNISQIIEMPKDYKHEEFYHE